MYIRVQHRDKTKKEEIIYMFEVYYINDTLFIGSDEDNIIEINLNEITMFQIL